MSSAGAGFEPTARAWVDHLRRGGAVPWREFVRSRATGAAAEPAARPPLPGAAQAELVRRLAARRASGTVVVSADAFTRLADDVLARSGTGRGLPDLPLAWPPDGAGVLRPSLGPRPMDPARVPVRELVRIAVGALVDLVQDDRVGGPARRRPRSGPRHWPWSRDLALAGAPGSVADVRAALAAAGVPVGGRHPEVLLLVPPFEVALGQVWAARVGAGAATRWQPSVGRWAARDRLPRGADLAGVATRWARRVGPERVHVIVGDAPGTLRRAVADRLGHRLGEAAHPVLTAAGVDALRRCNGLLDVRLPPQRHRLLLPTLHDLLGEPAPGHQPALQVPDRHRAWLERSARRVAEELSAGRYAVHGDLAQVALPVLDAPQRPRRHDVLDLLLDACLRAAARGAGPRSREP